MGSFAVAELFALVALWTAVVRHVHPWLLVPLACVTLISLQPIVLVLIDWPMPDVTRHLVAALLLTGFAAFAVTRPSRVALTLLAIWAGLTALQAVDRVKLATVPQPWAALVEVEIVLKIVIVLAVAYVTRKGSDLLVGRADAAVSSDTAAPRNARS